MRIKLKLKHRSNVLVPLNYQYEISSWIYKVISEGDSEFATWLHQKGYDHGNKQYRFFTFGRLESVPFLLQPEKNAMLLQSEQSQITLSFLVENAISYFVAGIFQKQKFGIGNVAFKPVDFEVASVEILPPPIFSETMTFKTMTPICLSTQSESDRYAQYLHPENEEYAYFFDSDSAFVN